MGDFAENVEAKVFLDEIFKPGKIMWIDEVFAEGKVRGVDKNTLKSVRRVAGIESATTPDGQVWFMPPERTSGTLTGSRK